MDKTKLLTISVIGLLILNFTILAYLFINDSMLKNPPHHSIKTPKEIIIEKLHLDLNQQKEYSNLINWHRMEINAIENEIHFTKNELYSILNESKENIKTKDSLISLLTNYQKKIEETHFQHFQEIKKLCNKEQLVDFKNLTEEFSNIFKHKIPLRPKHD